MIKLANDSFIPVAADDWYQRRRDDAEGAFLRRVAQQGPRKGGLAPGGSTRQGIYCLTASGKLLHYRNAQDASSMVAAVREGLRKWNALPANERKPGAVAVPALGKVDARYARTVPEGGLVLKVYTRILDKNADGDYRRATAKRGEDRAARDHLWLTKDEWHSLVPKAPRGGDTFAMPAALATRLLRFHLLDNTRGEPNYWRKEDIRKSSLTWTVAKVSDTTLALELTGSALLATKADAEKAERGYEVALRGTLEYDRKAGRITRFEVAAVGNHWGEGTYTRGARPGRKPLGVWMELTPAKNGADRVPPQGARTMDDYFAKAGQ